MERSNNANEIINASMNIIAENIERPEVIDFEKYSKVSLTEFASMGSFFASIPEALKIAQMNSDAGGEGIYRAIIEPGKALAEAKEMPGLFRGFTTDDFS